MATTILISRHHTVTLLCPSQTSIAAIVNHDDQEESAEVRASASGMVSAPQSAHHLCLPLQFRQLTSALFSGPAPSTIACGKGTFFALPFRSQHSRLGDVCNSPSRPQSYGHSSTDKGTRSASLVQSGLASVTPPLPSPTQLYDSLCSYWPGHMTQPRDNITDLIKLT